MKIIRRLTEEIGDYLYNQLEVYGYDFNNYIQSPYIHISYYNNMKYVYNILTDEIIELYPTEEIPIEYQIRKWYRFYKDLDPYTIASLAVKLNTAKIRTDLNLESNHDFTILTTSACNARCPYCFEKGRKYESMSDQVAKDIAKYLENQYCGIPIGICWFGGEPTINTKPIDIICNHLDFKNIPFFSFFVTNGSKLKDLDYYKLKYKWRTEDIQITLDGLYEEHEKVKQFIDGTKFSDIIDGINKLVNSNIQVGLRINIGPDPIEFEAKKKLAQWMVDNYGDKTNFVVTTASIYDTEFNRFSTEERSRSIEYNQQIHEILRQSPVYKRNSFLPSPYRDIYACIVQAREGYTIDVDGNLQICEYYTEGKTAIGSIYTGITNLDAIRNISIQKLEDKCKYCKYYPSCKYIQVCKSSGSCSTLDISKIDLNIDEFIRNYIDGRGQEEIG